MPDFAREFTDVCERIAEAERRIEIQHDKLARYAAGSDDARYSQALLHVLERSLCLMYARRDRIERELRQHRRAARVARGLGRRAGARGRHRTTGLSARAL
jgi:hypothetical protein